MPAPFSSDGLPFQSGCSVCKPLHYNFVFADAPMKGGKKSKKSVTKKSGHKKSVTKKSSTKKTRKHRGGSGLEKLSAAQKNMWSPAARNLSQTMKVGYQISSGGNIPQYYYTNKASDLPNPHATQAISPVYGALGDPHSVDAKAGLAPYPHTFLPNMKGGEEINTRGLESSSQLKGMSGSASRLSDNVTPYTSAKGGNKKSNQKVEKMSNCQKQQGAARPCKSSTKKVTKKSTTKKVTKKSTTKKQRGAGSDWAMSQYSRGPIDWIDHGPEYMSIFADPKTNYISYDKLLHPDTSAAQGYKMSDSDVLGFNFGTSDSNYAAVMGGKKKVASKSKKTASKSKKTASKSKKSTKKH